MAQHGFGIIGCGMIAEFHTRAINEIPNARVVAAYDQAVDKRANASDPQGPLYHTLRVFLIDRQGRIRNIYSSGTLDPRLVLADVKTLLLEEARLSKQ